MDIGSTGVIFGMYKYSLLLQYEGANKEPNWLEEEIEHAIL